MDRSGDGGFGGVREMTCDDVREMAGAFVLGALEPDDEAAVRAHLATCPEAHDEMGELGGAVAALAETVPQVEPPAALKGRIMAAAAADLGTRESAARRKRSRRERGRCSGSRERVGGGDADPGRATARRTDRLT